MNITTLSSSSTKFSEISGILSTLEINKLYRVSDIVKLINQISNLHTETLKGIPYPEKFSSTDHAVYIDELYVDMTYQRVLNLRTLIKKIQGQGFIKGAAGTIDIATRTRDGERIQTVWDGFRRTIMAALCQYKNIPYSETTHDQGANDKDCQKKEAGLFIVRNTNEKIKPEELFKAEVGNQDPTALEILEFLKDCNLDVGGLNPDARPLGGFSEIKSNFKGWNKNAVDPNTNNTYGWDRDSWITASKIIQKTWPNVNEDPVVSVYLLSNIAWVLTVMETCSTTYDDTEIIKCLENWMKENQSFKQKDITSAGFKNKHLVSLYIVNNILKDKNGLKDKLHSHLDEEQKKLFKTIM